MTDDLSDLTALRHDLHRHPELGFQEVRTKALVAERLRKLGFTVEEGVGVTGTLRAGTGNRSIGVRADMDALPIQETRDSPYRSQTDGVMHACGHDGHTAILLGAAEILARDPEFDGTLVLFFQPNEEHGLGAQAMIADGALRRHPVDEIYALHNLPGVPVGHVMTRVGQICASESLFEIRITGKGGHASMPQTGVDALTVGAEIALALQTIVARKLAPGAGAVVSVTEFLTNGQRNVLPGHATLKGDVRARDPQDRDRIAALMRQIANGVADAHGAQVEVAFNTEFIETLNAPTPVAAAARVARAQGLVTDADCAPMSFSEDFAHFCAAVPGCFLLMGNGTEGAVGQPLHAADYDFNDALLPIGAAFWAGLVRDRLAKDQIPDD